MTYRTNPHTGVTVSTDLHYLPMDSCPRGSKVLLLTLGKVAIVGHYRGEQDDGIYRGWFPLPKARPDQTRDST